MAQGYAYFEGSHNPADLDDAIVKLNKAYIESKHPKLSACGYVFLAQRLLLKSQPNYEKIVELWQRALTYASTNPIALYNLGVHYYLGKGVQQNFETAFGLFKKAAHLNNYLWGCRNFGVKESSFAVGKCYEDGKGRPQNHKKAGDYYFESYRCDIGYGPAAVKYSNLCKNGLMGSSDEMKNASAAKRFLDAAAKWGNIADDSIDFLLNFENPVPMLITETNSSTAKYWVHEKEIRMAAETLDMEFSINLRNAMNEFAQGVYAMSSYFDDTPKNTPRERVDIVQQEIIHHVASAFRWSIEDVASCESNIWTKFQQFINSNINLPLDDMNNTSDLDRDARICKLVGLEQSIFGHKFGQSLNLFLKFLKQSKTKYPKELFFHRKSLQLAGLIEFDLDSTIQQFPSNSDIFYLRGIIIEKRSVEQLIKEKAYLDFIKIAPRDHKYLPETFYRLAYLYRKSRNLRKCRAYYERGVDAEKHLLSFYLPYQSMFKEDVQKILNK